MGFGRSYGKESWFFGKKFSGISLSSIWETLSREPAHNTIAFLTDVGNDLAYEVPVDTIYEWVTTCIDRLEAQCATIAMTSLPIDVLRGVTGAKFQLLRSIFFPHCRLSQSVLVGRAEQLDDRLRQLAESQKIPCFSAPNTWYGFDPIHPRGRYLKQYWCSLFSLVVTKKTANESRGQSLRTWLRLRTLSSPASGSKTSQRPFLPRRLLLDDGSSIALY